MTTPPEKKIHEAVAHSTDEAHEAGKHETDKLAEGLADSTWGKAAHDTLAHEHLISAHGDGGATHTKLNPNGQLDCCDGNLYEHSHINHEHSELNEAAERITTAHAYNPDAYPDVNSFLATRQTSNEEKGFAEAENFKKSLDEDKSIHKTLES
jgi:hypothetical protein